MDIVYIVRPGDINEELRFSLRSLRHLPVDRVWLVGHKPHWVTGVEHIPGNRFAAAPLNVHDNLALACRHVDAHDDVVIMNDDFFLARPIDDIPHLYRGRLVDHVDSQPGMSAWARSLRTTLEWLRARGFADPISWELHTPIRMDLDRLGWILAETRGPQVPAQWRTCYGNHFLDPAGAELWQDQKANGPHSLLDPDAWCWSTHDSTFFSHPIGEQIRRMFPDPSPYEARSSMSEAPLLRVAKSFAVGPRIWRRGTVVHADDPIVAGRERLFVPAVPEQATARPGELRATPPPAAEPEQPDVEGIPRKAPDIITWIGDDPTRARAALDAEQQARSPRTTVVDHANQVLASTPT